MPVKTFDVTESEQTWDVPPGVEETILRAWGAGGAAGGDGDAGTGAAGADGGFAEGTLTTTPGETLRVYVGQSGTDGEGPTGATGGTGGWPSGGDGGDGGGSSSDVGGSGGGAGGHSDVRASGSDFPGDVVLVGGGGAGGGAGSDDGTGGGAGGAGGGTQGADGNNGGSGTGGDGGTQSAGNAQPNGGNGAQGSSNTGAGGGAGGGYWGGAGGDDGDGGGGGGGGSGFLASKLTSTTLTQAGGNAGDGQVAIAYVEPPNNLTVSSVSDDLISISWEAVTGADEYTVYRGQSSGSEPGDYSITNTGITTTSFSVSGLENGEEFFFRVTATDTSEGLESTVSNEVSAVTDLPAPSIDDVSATRQARGTVELTISNADNSTDGNFELYRSTDGTLGSQIATPARGDTSYTDEGVDGDTQYFYTLRRVTDHAETDSTQATVTVPELAPTGVSVTEVRR